MAVQSLTRDQWPQYFRQVSSLLSGQQIEEENMGQPVMGGSLTRSSLRRLGYDPAHDQFEIDTGTARHLIARPREIRVELLGNELRTIEITDDTGCERVLRIRNRTRED